MCIFNLSGCPCSDSMLSNLYPNHYLTFLVSQPKGDNRWPYGRLASQSFWLLLFIIDHFHTSLPTGITCTNLVNVTYPQKRELFYSDTNINHISGSVGLRARLWIVAMNGNVRLLLELRYSECVLGLAASASLGNSLELQNCRFYLRPSGLETVF